MLASGGGLFSFNPFNNTLDRRDN